MYIIGHRGAKGLLPENTLASIQRALDLGVDEVETDCRVTRDGIVVQVHDDHLDRPTSQPLIIAESTYAELKAAKPDLSTLGEVIRLVNRRVPLRVEVKPGVPVDPVVTCIQQFLHYGWTTADFLLASRDQKVLRSLHAALPGISKVVIEYWSSLRAVRRARQVNTKHLSMLEYWLWPGFIRNMTRRGFILTSFPPNSPAKERFYARFGLAGRTNNPKHLGSWKRSGLSGVVTDYPDRFKDRT